MGIKKMLVAVLLSAGTLAAVSCSPTSPAHHFFSWQVTGTDGMPVTLDYRYDGRHVDLQANGTGYNEAYLPVANKNAQFVDVGDTEELKVSYLDASNASDPLTILFREDDAPLTTVVGRGSADCFATIK